VACSTAAEVVDPPTPIRANKTTDHHQDGHGKREVALVSVPLSPDASRTPASAR
jgi:hypothetical protein